MLKLLAGGPINCTRGWCPAVYQTDRATIVIQGWRVTTDVRSELRLDSGEDAVEVPTELVEALLNALPRK